jgi:DNA invertase Pin-like site-specific DNA recombinase
MTSPQRPAAYACEGRTGETESLSLAAQERGWPAPLVYAETGSPAGRTRPELNRLEAAITAGRHDALLIPLACMLGNRTSLMSLLRSCTRHGVTVTLVPASSANAARPQFSKDCWLVHWPSM